MKTKLTIVVPVYNREIYLIRCLESIFHQTFQDWNLILVDDFSIDNSVDVIKNYTSGDSRVTIIEKEKNEGVGKALSDALQQIATPYFMVVDSDDWIEPTAAEELLHKLEASSRDVSLVYGNMLTWEEDRNGELMCKEYTVHKPFTDKYEFLMYPPMPSPRMFSTEWVKKVNGFENDDPYGGRFAEDRYLLIKLIAVSRFEHVDKHLYNIRIHQENTTKKENRKYFGEVRKYVYNKLLKEWGDEYEPVFEWTEAGWMKLSDLKLKEG
ncbi:glycosyltransferase involved in cell wall biosynthesis [Bacillus fengqiuensis]|nr:glycosyltransferase involved in cell wall biosynthesis [Bacillus fengqiuensis]